MEKFLFITTLFLPLLLGCVSQESKPEQLRTLDDIKEFSGMSKDVLYQKSMLWAARSFKSANDVIQLKDPVAGHIVCKGSRYAPHNFGLKILFDFTLIIDVKDGKLRTRFENIIGLKKEGVLGGPDSNMEWEWEKGEWEQVSKKLLTIREDLYLSIENKKENADW